MEGEATGAALAIGGTGMLAGATRWLARRSTVTVVAARRAGRFAAGDPRFLPVDADWRHASFHEALEGALQDVPQVARALIWLHDPATVLPRLLSSLESARVVLVLGSRQASPGGPATARTTTVRLGSMPVPDGSRWLTHEEISAAAIDALRDGRSRIVGELVPVD